MTTIEKLYQTLDQRRRPEDVAEMIVELMRSHLAIHELATLSKAANRSLKNNIYGYTSMLETFGKAIGADKQIKKAIEIFKIDQEENSGHYNANGIETFLNKVSPLIHKDVGQNDFKKDRLNKDLRKLAGLKSSKLMVWESPCLAIF